VFAISGSETFRFGNDCSPVPSLSENIASDPISLYPGEHQRFTFLKQPGTTTVMCETAGDNGDADLYLRWDAEPDLFDLFLNDCVSRVTGSVERCVVEDPGFGFARVLWVTIVPYYDSFTDVTITCRST
jgi:hypothetical protein